MRLTLKKELLTELTDGELQDVAGGTTTNEEFAASVTACAVSNLLISVCDCLTRNCNTLFC